MPRVQLLAVAALGTAAVACHEPEPDLRSEHVDLFLDEDIRVCAGQLDSYDAFIDEVFEFWNESSVPTGFRPAVHALASSRCDGHSCASRGNAWLFGDLGQYHELTHVIHYSLDGSSARALAEGVAEGLGPLGGIAYRQADLDALQPDFLYKSDINATEYGYASVFTRFLVDRHGVAPFRDYFRTMGSFDNPEPADFGAAFEAAFSEPLGASWQEFTSASRCAYDFWFCSASPSVQMTLPSEFTDIDCADETTLGFDASALQLDGTYSPTVILRFANEIDRPVQLSFKYAFVYLNRCGNCDDQARIPEKLFLSDSENAPPFVLSMPAGDYVFIVRAVEGGETRVTLAEYE